MPSKESKNMKGRGRLVAAAMATGVILSNYEYSRPTEVLAFPLVGLNNNCHRRLQSLPASPSDGEKGEIEGSAVLRSTLNSRPNDSSDAARRSRRKPPFPESAYNLAKDEERLQHNFISFIDQSIWSSYSQVTRMVEPRIYARPDQFTKDKADVPPTIDDVAPPPSLYGPVGQFLAWNKFPARLVVGTVSYLLFPYLIDMLQQATQNVNDSAFSVLVNSTFLPGISIILGTYFSLTLSILYGRKARIQETAALEAGLLALTCENLLELFADDAESAVEGAQCVADQIRTMVRDSRGREVMGVIYGDPYARINRLVNERDRRGGDGGDLDGSLADNVRGAVGDLYQLRTKRMSDEALALAPTHFDVMTFLSGLLVAGFALGTVAMRQTESVPVRILFASLIVSYTIFYEMSFDLNRPFDGVYQVRRDAAAMYFLRTKHLICTHPLVKGRVDFEVVEDDYIMPDCDPACKRRKDNTWFN